jgi:hypothetical protein
MCILCEQKGEHARARVFRERIQRLQEEGNRAGTES